MQIFTPRKHLVYQRPESDICFTFLLSNYVRKKLRLLFFVRKPKNYKTGPLPIYLKITIDSAATELSSKRKCEPSQWSGRSGRAIGNKESVKELNH